MIMVAGAEVYKVSSRNRVQQRFLEQISLTIQFLTVVVEGEVFKAFSQDRAQLPLHLALVLQMKLGKGFSHFSPREKSAGLGPRSGSELGADSSYDQETRLLLESLHRRREAEEAARLALVEEEQMEEDEDEEEERVEVSRFLPHFRPRRWCWYVHAGSICPRGWNCTFAHHESELHPDSW